MLILQRSGHFLSFLHSTICRQSQWRRSVSQFTYLCESLPLRPRNLIYDDLSPTNSRLLDVTLADFVTQEHSLQNSFSTEFVKLRLPAQAELPQGHHLVYFPTQVPDSALLSDGTDTLQYPGPPFIRRLWLGGDLTFRSPSNGGFKLNGCRASCAESIKNATVKGLDGRDSVVVSIERRYDYVEAQKEKAIEDVNMLERAQQGCTVSFDEDSKNDAVIVETRDLVFLRAKSAEEVRADAIKPQRILRSSGIPDFSISFTPTQSLLFRFSALTFNAHLIHLDPRYAFEIEGYRNLVVHGPLTLILMLSVLRLRLPAGNFVRKFTYRNLMPLYADEALRICMRQSGTKGKIEVWIEGKDGNLAVRASAFVETESS